MSEDFKASLTTAEERALLAAYRSGGRDGVLRALGMEQVGWEDERYDGLLYEMGLADTRSCRPVFASRVGVSQPEECSREPISNEPNTSGEAL